MKLEFTRQSFEKYSNTKFNENPSSGSRAVDGWTDRQTAMPKPIFAFRSFANAPEMSQIHCVGKIENFRILSLVLSRYSYSLGAGRSGDRVPMGARFSAPVQTGSKAHPASCTMGTGSFPRVKRPGRGVDHLPPSSAELNGRV